MRWVWRQGLHYLEFPQLARVAGIRHAIFLRFSEMQTRRRRSFNLGLSCKNSEDRVQRRRARIRTHFGFDTMIYARQVHGNRVRLWPPDDDLGTEIPHRDDACLNGDGLVTRSDRKALLIQTADCQAILIADPRKRVVANVHAGWRGSISNIIGRTVDLIIDRFGCRPEDLRCGIGPSLGPCCAEFVNYRAEIPEIFWRYRLSADRFDFWRVSLDQLVNAGVKAEHVEISGICTRCNPHLFYSYRGEGQTGRFAAIIGLKDG
jgi:YfiH family protein